MKKNLLKIPKRVLDRVNAFELDDIVVACAKRLSLSDVVRYQHLGLFISEGKVILPPARVPDARAGRYSSANVNGREVVRRDLPMVTKTFSWESPNWGDWSNGSHTHYQTRDVYQRDFYAPKEVELSITEIEKISDDEVVLKFAIDQVLNKNASDFEDDLLYNLNLLQENVGSVDVFPSAASLAEYMRTVQVDWEILPPGKVEDVVKRMLSGKRPVSNVDQKKMEQRLAVMARHKPTAYIAGTNGFLRYFGAMFSDDLVAFENLSYGNALYVMYENWKTLSQRSRIDLLKGPRDGFDRVEHREGWEERLNTLVKDHKKRTAK